MSIYTNWDRLQEVIVGNCYDSVPENTNLGKDQKRLLNRILSETKEDLDKLAGLLNQLGVSVYRPSLKRYPSSINLPDFQVSNATNPIIPRDQYLVYGKTIYQTYTSMSDRYFDSYQYYEIFKDLFDNNYNWISQPPPLLTNFTHNKKWYVDGDNIYGEKLKNKLLWHTATMFKCGDTIITNNAGPGTQAGLDWMKRNINAGIIHNDNTKVNNWGHIDHGFYMIDDNTVICMNEEWVPEPLKNKKIIELEGLFEPFDYQTFIKETHHIKDVSNLEWLHMWLSEWMGYSQDVVFETNVLVVDRNNIVFSTEQPKVFEILNKIGINCHVSKIRHGLFWEGGIHCMTLDIKRDGLKRSVV